MSDIDGSGQIPRRSGRAGDGGAPVSGALAIVLSVVAVVAGFLILNSISDDETQADFPPPGDVSDDDAPPVDGTTDPSGSSTPTLPTTTTVPALQVEGASVIVANANGQGGSAGRVTTVLETGAGFTTVQATNANTNVGDLDDSVIYYDTSMPQAQVVADSVNRALGGGLLVQPKPEVAPISDGDMRGAGVLLMLGKDHADITVDQLALPGSSDATAITNPPTGATTPSTEADG